MRIQCITDIIHYKHWAILKYMDSVTCLISEFIAPIILKFNMCSAKYIIQNWSGGYALPLLYHKGNPTFVLNIPPPILRARREKRYNSRLFRERPTPPTPIANDPVNRVFRLMPGMLYRKIYSIKRRRKQTWKGRTALCTDLEWSFIKNPQSKVVYFLWMKKINYDVSWISLYQEV